MKAGKQAKTPTEPPGATYRRSRVAAWPHPVGKSQAIHERHLGRDGRPLLSLTSKAGTVCTPQTATGSQTAASSGPLLTDSKKATLFFTSHSTGLLPVKKSLKTMGGDQENTEGRWPRHSKQTHLGSRGKFYIHLMMHQRESVAVSEIKSRAQHMSEVALLALLGLLQSHPGTMILTLRTA